MAPNIGSHEVPSMFTKTNSVNPEKGAALIFALLGLVLLTLLGLSFAFQSNIEYRISENYITHQESLAIADAGLNTVKAKLQKSDFNTVLTTQSDVPAYVDSDEPAAGSDASRNAISARAARNVNFSSAPTPVKTYQATGIMTPVTGQTYGNGRYFAKVSNNSFGPSSQIFGKDPDPKTDTDYRVLLRVTGIRSTLAAEKVGSTKTVPNSVAIVEAMFKRNTTFDLKSPLSVNGPSVDATFTGNKFDVDGYNHNGMTRAEITSAHTENATGAVPGLAAINNNPSGNDAASIAQSLYDMLNGKQSDNVVGAPGIHVDDTPSVADITNILRTSSDPDTSKVLDANFVGTFVDRVKPYANIYYGASQDLSGNNVQLGTDANPKITYVNGDLKLSGSGSGAGILIVKGNLDVGGSFTFDGVVLVVGDGSIKMHGTNESFIGGMYVQNLTKNASGSYVAGQATIRLDGNTDFYFSSDMINIALKLLPLEMLEWREITPEISK